MSPVPVTHPPPGTVFYDGACGFCRGSLRRFGGPFRKAGFTFVPYQEAAVGECNGMACGEFANEMKLRRHDGRWFGGADAWFEMCAAVNWLRPVAWLGRLPGLLQLSRWMYRRIAANRHRLGARCELPGRDAP